MAATLTFFSSLALSIQSSQSPDKHVSAVPLTPREAASGLLGSISLACWLFLLLPQLVENYRNQSAEAISLAFIFVWFVGDVCNLFGAMWAGLVPVVIAIAVYFCIADGVLIGQVLYYGIRNKRREGRGLLESVKSTIGEEADAERDRFSISSTDNANAHANHTSVTTSSGSITNGEPRSGENETQHESTPLLADGKPRTSRTASVTIPGSVDLGLQRRKSRGSEASARRRRSSAADARTGGDEPLAKILEESDRSTGARLWAKNIVSILAVGTVGALGWLLAYESGAWKASPDPSTSQPGTGPGDEEEMARGAQVLGYVSAIAYLGARIPQIVKNARERSCEGLSLLFFVLSLMGNLTYGAGILFHSTERQYFMTNLPWLIGSLGTMVEDVTIFVQFHLYRDASKNDGEDVEEDEHAVITE